MLEAQAKLMCPNYGSFENKLSFWRRLEKNMISNVGIYLAETDGTVILFIITNTVKYFRVRAHTIWKSLQSQQALP